jgi:predicted transcriptional regulator
MTRIQIKVNVPFIRFKEYFDDLQKKGLIYTASDITLTEQGIQYLEEYRKVQEFMKKFGLVRQPRNNLNEPT